MNAVRALNGAFGTIAAAYAADFGRQISEVYNRLMEIACKIVICEKAQDIGNRHPFRAFPITAIAHTTIIRPDLLVQSEIAAVRRLEYKVQT